MRTLQGRKDGQVALASGWKGLQRTFRAHSRAEERGLSRSSRRTALRCIALLLKTATMRLLRSSASFTAALCWAALTVAVLSSSSGIFVQAERFLDTGEACEFPIEFKVRDLSEAILVRPLPFVVVKLTERASASVVVVAAAG